MHKTGEPKQSENISSYITLIIASILAFFTILLLIDRNPSLLDFMSANYSSESLQDSIVWMSMIALVVLSFSGFGVLLFEWLMPENSEVKKIDFIWYIGTTFGLILGLLDYQANTHKTNRVVYQSALITSHATLRDYCWVLNPDNCANVDSILALESDEILKIINAETVDFEYNDTSIKNIDDLREAQNALYGISPSGDLLVASIETLLERNDLDELKIFGDGKYWLLVYASILGIRISKTRIELRR